MYINFKLMSWVTLFYTYYLLCIRSSWLLVHNGSKYKATSEQILLFLLYLHFRVNFAFRKTRTNKLSQTQVDWLGKCQTRSSTPPSSDPHLPNAVAAFETFFRAIQLTSLAFILSQCDSFFKISFPGPSPEETQEELASIMYKAYYIILTA